MPKGSSFAAGWFVKVVKEAIKGLKREARLLDVFIIYDPDLTADTAHIRSFSNSFENTT